jgi:hypothetical protein
VTIDDVLTLAKAGYTRDEIALMLQPAPADPAPADPAPAPADPAPAPAGPAPAKEDVPAWAQALSESLAALTKAVQTNNAMHDEQLPAPAQSAVDAVLMKQLH